MDYLLYTTFNRFIQNLNCINIIITGGLSFGTIYVNRLSNDPLDTVQQILLPISLKTLNISLKKFTFNNSILIYKNSLKIVVFYDHRIYSSVIESNNTWRSKTMKKK